MVLWVHGEAADAHPPRGTQPSRLDARDAGPPDSFIQGKCSLGSPKLSLNSLHDPFLQRQVATTDSEKSLLASWLVDFLARFASIKGKGARWCRLCVRISSQPEAEVLVIGAKVGDHRLEEYTSEPS